MGYKPTGDFSNLELEYNAWLGSRESKKTIEYTIDNKKIWVVFNESHWVYPLYEERPRYKKESINIAPSDTGIKEKVKANLQPLGKRYMFNNSQLSSFELRFFKNMEKLNKKLQAENSYYASHQSPQNLTVSRCVLL